MSNLLKSFIPHAQREKLKNTIHQFHKIVSPFFAKTPGLTSLYFLLFNRSYYREQYAALQGNLAYLKRINSSQEMSNPLLRRNIHRLEKGLIMRPRKSVFALDYIEETQECFFMAANNRHHDMEEIQWAASVLSEFYLSIDLHQSELLRHLSSKFEQHSNSKTRFDTVANSDTCIGFKKIPYSFSDLPLARIDYQQFSDFIKLRRSTRWFKQTKVCHDKLNKAVLVASQAPSACNRQPYKFYVIDQEPLLEKVSKLAIGSGGFANNIPCIIALVGDYSYYEDVRDRHVIYIDSSLAAMQFMQTLPTLGLASCPLNWPELKVVDRKLAKLLKLEKHQKTIMLIAVGEPDEDGGIPFSQKKSSEQLIHFVDIDKE